MDFRCQLVYPRPRVRRRRWIRRNRLSERQNGDADQPGYDNFFHGKRPFYGLVCFLNIVKTFCKIKLRCERLPAACFESGHGVSVLHSLTEWGNDKTGEMRTGTGGTAAEWLYCRNGHGRRSRRPAFSRSASLWW